jgi:hypothetical protein
MSVLFAIFVGCIRGNAVNDIINLISCSFFLAFIRGYLLWFLLTLSSFCGKALFSHVFPCHKSFFMLFFYDILLKCVFFLLSLAVSVPSIMLSVSLGTDSQWVNYTLAGGVLL